MAKSIKQNVVVDTLADDVAKLSDTAKKIRHLYAHFASIDKSKAMSMTYKKINELGVRTKNNTEIRYQHVRNTVLTPLTGK